MKRPKVGFDLSLLDEESNVASQTECTGLIMIPPEDDWERESYKDIYEVPRKNKYEDTNMTE